MSNLLLVERRSVVGGFVGTFAGGLALAAVFWLIRRLAHVDLGLIFLYVVFPLAGALGLVALYTLNSGTREAIKWAQKVDERLDALEQRHGEEETANDRVSTDPDATTQGETGD